MSYDLIKDDKVHHCVHGVPDGAEEPHICPYASDIHGDFETLCTCCELCQRQCAMDI